MTSLKMGLLAVAMVVGVSGCMRAERAIRGEGDTPRSVFQEGSAYDVSGTVVRVDGDKVTLAREGLPTMQLEVERNTLVTLNGFQSNVRAIPEGGMVRAKFQVIEDRPVAVRLDVSSTGAAQQPSMEQPGTEQPGGQEFQPNP